MNELSLYILDIVQNSLKADSKNVELIIDINESKDSLQIKVNDDGKGMSEEILNKALTPFYTTRTTRRVGLGLPLLKELCELCEGKLDIESKINIGTKLNAQFKYSSIDLPPFGNLVDTLYLLIINEDDVDIKFKYIKNGKEFIFDTKQIKEILDGVSIKDPLLVDWIKTYLNDGINEINNLGGIQ